MTPPFKLPVDTEVIDPECIRRDGGTQTRAALNEEAVEDYKNAYLEGADLPPVVVVLDGDDYWLADGFHRVEAAIRAEITEIWCYEVMGTRLDALRYALQANVDHGVRRSRADKQHAVDLALQEESWRGFSDREIARMCSVSHTMVAERRKLMAGSGGNSATTEPTNAESREAPPETGSPSPAAPSSTDVATQPDRPAIKLPSLEDRLALTVHALECLHGATSIADLRARAFPDGIDEEPWRKTLVEGAKRNLWGHEGKVLLGALVGPIWRRVREPEPEPEPPPFRAAPPAEGPVPDPTRAFLEEPLDPNDPAHQGHLARQEDEDCDGGGERDLSDLRRVRSRLETARIPAADIDDLLRLLMVIADGVDRKVDALEAKREMEIEATARWVHLLELGKEHRLLRVEQLAHGRMLHLLEGDDNDCDGDEEEKEEPPAPRGEAELLVEALQGASISHRNGLVPMDKAREAFAFMVTAELAGTVPNDQWARVVRVAQEDGLVHKVGTSLRLAPAPTRTEGPVSKAPDYDSDAWGTPPDILEDVRAVLGAIDLDPASNEAAQKLVQATDHYTKAENGLDQVWEGRVWLNPPFSHPLVEQFTDKLVAEYDCDNVVAALLIVNNATETKWFQRLLRRFPACFPEGRTSFLYGEGGEHVGARQGQVFFYLGADVARFREVFGARGTLVESQP